MSTAARIVSIAFRRGFTSCWISRLPLPGPPGRSGPFALTRLNLKPRGRGRREPLPHASLGLGLRALSDLPRLIVFCLSPQFPCSCHFLSPCAVHNPRALYSPSPSPSSPWFSLHSSHLPAPLRHLLAPPWHLPAPLRHLPAPLRHLARLWATSGAPLEPHTLVYWAPLRHLTSLWGTSGAPCMPMGYLWKHLGHRMQPEDPTQVAGSNPDIWISIQMGTIQMGRP